MRSVSFFTVLIILCFSLTGCFQSGKDFSLRVELPEDAEGYPVFLVKAGAAGMAVVDSALVKHGKFTLKNDRIEEGVYYLRYDDKPVALFYLTKSKMKIQIGEWLNPEMTLISGDSLTQLFQTFVEGISQRAMMGTQQQLAYVKELTEQHLNTPVGVYFLYSYLLTELSDEDLTAMTAKIDTSLNSNEFVQAIQSYSREIQRVIPGSPYLDFSAVDEKGSVHRLQDLIGKKVLLLHFWASWGIPCRKDMDRLKALNTKYGKKNFEMAGISIDNSRKAWTDALREESPGWNMWRDTTGVAAQTYQVEFIPHYVLFSEEGKVYAKGNNLNDISRDLTTLMEEN